jgi:hypothetical protein
LEPEAVFPKMRMLIFSSALTKIGAKIRIFTKSWRIKFREVPLSIFSLPSLARTKEIFKRLTAKEKFIGILIIILVIFIPLAVVKFSNVREETTVLPEPDPALDRRQNLAGEKNIKLDTVARMIYQGEEALLVETMNKEVFIATAEKIIAIGKSGEQSEYSISSDLGKIIKVAPMEDLNMIFLLTDKNKIVSFSPSSKDFKENSISIEEGKNICCIATYLTYLYVIAENDIWRYPRAEGGFGQPVSWLKEEINLGEARDATIDENIYLALEEKALKLFQGKKEEFNIESFQTAINFSRIYTAREFSNLYVLDNITSRIIRFSKNGEILAQYYNDMLLGAKDLAVDEKGSAAFFVTVSGGVAEIEL